MKNAPFLWIRVCVCACVHVHMCHDHKEYTSLSYWRTDLLTSAFSEKTFWERSTDFQWQVRFVEWGRLIDSLKVVENIFSTVALTFLMLSLFFNLPFLICCVTWFLCLQVYSHLYLTFITPIRHFFCPHLFDYFQIIIADSIFEMKNVTIG